MAGVDPGAPLLAAFTERARRLGDAASGIQGVWPDSEDHSPVTDIVVCHYVFYNVPGLATFAAALTRHARHRLIVELTAVHPMSWLAPYWKFLRGLDQSEGLTAKMPWLCSPSCGYGVRQKQWRRHYQMIGEPATWRCRASLAGSVFLPIATTNSAGSSPPSQHPVLEKSSPCGGEHPRRVCGRPAPKQRPRVSLRTSTALFGPSLPGCPQSAAFRDRIITA